MKLEQFIKSNTGTWKELELYSETVERKGIKSLTSGEVKRFLRAFRLTSHHLSYAKTYYPGSQIEKYLNALVGRCHSHIYAVRKVSPGQFLHYIAYGYPKLLNENRSYILFSSGIFLTGFLISLVLVLVNKENAALFLPEAILNGANGGSGSSQWNYPLMSSYIMVNNISVALRAFVFGITLGAGTAYVLFVNGTLLGALTGLVYLFDSPLNYWSLILPHGIIELSAIFISGGAGFIIAKYFILPGEYTRKQSLVLGAKKAVSLILGVVLMLVIAGIIEGFFTPLPIAPWAKLAFAAATLFLEVFYCSFPLLRKKNKEK